MKLTTVKGKVLAGVAALTLVSGAGFVAANTDAGANLQSWYNKAFGVTELFVKGETGAHAIVETAKFGEHANEERKDGVNSIKQTKDDEKTDTTKNIHDAKQSHIDAVDKKQSEISGYMETQFNKLSENSIKDFNKVSNVTYFLAELGVSGDINKTGNAAFKSLEQELNDERKAAVTELQERILKAKNDLLAQLTLEKDATTKEIKDAIDVRILEMTKDITAKKNELVKKHQDKLIAKADEIEKAAKAELDKAVATGF